MVRSRFACGLHGMLALLSASCGDDDPAGTGSPCDDGSTSCLDITVTDAGVTYLPFYQDPPLDMTLHSIQWQPSGIILSDYAPGQRIWVNVTFDPPVRVRWQHSGTTFSLNTGVLGCTDRYAHPTAKVSASGWMLANKDVTCSGYCTTGESQVALYATFGPLQVGDELEHLRFEFTVPETYTSGAGMGTPILPGDLAVSFLTFSVSTFGNSISAGPPFWPGEYQP